MLTRKRKFRNSDRFIEMTRKENEFVEPIFDKKLSRKRKHRDNSDSLSVRSLDVSFKEPACRKKRLSRVASLATLFSPVRPVMKVGEVLQRSWSGAKISSPILIPKPLSTESPVPMSPASSPSGSASSREEDVLSSSLKKNKSHATCSSTRQRQSRLWRETIGRGASAHLNESEIRRQEAIFELYQGEEDIVEDLHLVKSTYHDSLLRLNIMTNDELQQIFGSLHTLEPLHHDLVDKLRMLRDENGVTESVGEVLVKWAPCLNEYVAYCANQVYAKAMLDEKKLSDRRVEDFLQRCLESPFSRKLDLWNFLDVPRNRLVKYPLLLKNIIKLLVNHDDKEVDLLKRATAMIEEIISTVDRRMGEAECRFFINKLDFLEDQQKDPAIALASCLLCKGILRNNRGTKLNAFLFNRVLVLTRPVTRGERGRVYQVYRQPISAEELVLEDLKDGEIKMGSFRSAFSHGQTNKVKNVFRVSFKNQVLGQGHTLQAVDEHDKKQWISNLRKVISDQNDRSR